MNLSASLSPYASIQVITQHSYPEATLIVPSANCMKCLGQGDDKSLIRSESCFLLKGLFLYLDHSDHDEKNIQVYLISHKNI